MSAKKNKRSSTREYLMKMLFQMESQGNFKDEEKEAFLNGFAAEDICSIINEENEKKHADDPDSMPEKLMPGTVSGNISKYLDMDYFNAAFNAYIMHNNDIDDIIDKYSQGWNIDRIAKVDLSLLRLSIAEMKFMEKPEIPVSVSISEAVRIAKIYGGEDSGKFVNGILGKISREEADAR